MPQSPNSPFTLQRRLRNAKIREFDIIDRFKFGYRNREDQTNLPPGVLVVGSQNILTNVSERIQARNGYVLDGPISSVTVPIDAAYTYFNHNNVENNLRTYMPSAGMATVEYRYVDAAGVVTWRTLLSSLSSSKFNFTTFWDTVELKRVLLMVNGTTTIYEWDGAITTILVAGAGTLTKTGTDSWATAGFYVSNSPRKVTINGIDYTYTGGENTTTLTGVTPDPNGVVLPGDIAHQTPILTNAPTGLALTGYDLISTLRNQVYVGQLTNQELFISKVNNYKDYTFTSPTRVVGEGAIAYLDSPPNALIPLETSINVSAGKNQWYIITWTLSADLTDESVTVNRLKTNSNASAQSQAMTSAMKNDVIFISQEPTLDTLGRVEQIFGTTQTTNMSDPIKLDFDSYDFTDAAIFYNKYFIYLAVPKHGLIRIYNIVKSYWEAPQTIPVGKFYTVGGILYGHSYQTAESYKLFSGRADRIDPVTAPSGNPIDCRVIFSYQNYSSPFTLKNFNKFYIEGYISSGTTLSAGIMYDIDGCATATSFDIDGSNSQYVCISSGTANADDASLGKQALGKYPLGGNIDVTGSNTIPPKFRLIQTFPSVDFHEVQYSFESSQRGANWEILRFGPALEYSANIPTSITN